MTTRLKEIADQIEATRKPDADGISDADENQLKEMRRILQGP
jgi:hypothetical protein